MQDLQKTAPTEKLAINKVGVKDLRHPINIRSANGKIQTTVATIDMAVGLAPNMRGTHMSRFIEILNQKTWTIDSVDGINQMLDITAASLESDSAYIQLEFPYFLNKQAPVSKTAGLVDYQITISGYKTTNVANKCFIKISIPITTLCPCSKAISAYGAHNQRGTLSVTIGQDAPWNIDELIQLIEKHGSAEIYSMLKRVDEKYVTEYAYDNPKFVEDIVRGVASMLNAMTGLFYYKITCENFESIHNHSAYAEMEKN